MRTERLDIYLDYLRSVEDSWSLLDGLWGRQPLRSASGEPLVGEAVDREAAIRNHEVWYYQQKLALVAPDRVRDAALELTKKLYEATFHRERIAEGLWPYLDATQEAFLTAARDDLEFGLPRVSTRSVS
jgi:hypothetical protein